MRRVFAWAVVAAALLGCASSPKGGWEALPEPLIPPSAHPSAVSAASSPTEGPAVAKARALLERVAKLRGLPLVREVPMRVLDRAALRASIREQVERDTPREPVVYEGELLAALEVLPLHFDLFEGSLALMGQQVAGFYDPATGTMFLAADLTDDEAQETLVHELVHALEDQSFHLAPTLAYRPGTSDRVAAAHAVIEGDAMSTTSDLVAEGRSPGVPAASDSRAVPSLREADAPPRILVNSLLATYQDGLAFVQQRRSRGGFPAVDAAFREFPLSTEQLLHEDKYEAREAPVPVEIPRFEVLGPGFHVVADDAMGEQGLRTILEEWACEAVAARAAAGWGGDRYVVLRRDAAGPASRPAFAFAWHLVFDTERDALEMMDLTEHRFGRGCRLRRELGPIVFRRRKADVVVAIGPYDTEGSTGTSAGNCDRAVRWATSIF